MTIQRLTVLKVLLFLAVGATIYCFAYAAAVAPLGDGKRMGLRGL